LHPMQLQLAVAVGGLLMLLALAAQDQEEMFR
jgi:hypothetical protein